MPRTWTTILRGLPVVGLALIITGVVLPSYTWWDPAGFLVNLVSGATAACFGIPLAFFVIETLSKQKEDFERLDQVLEDVESGASTLLRAAWDCGGVATLDQLLEAHSLLLRAKGAIAELHDCLRSRRTLVTATGSDIESVLLSGRVHDLSEHYDPDLVDLQRANFRWVVENLSGGVSARLREESLLPVNPSLLKRLQDFVESADCVPPALPVTHVLAGRQAKLRTVLDLARSRENGLALKMQMREGARLCKQVEAALAQGLYLAETWIALSLDVISLERGVSLTKSPNTIIPFEDPAEPEYDPLEVGSWSALPTPFKSSATLSFLLAAR